MSDKTHTSTQRHRDKFSKMFGVEMKRNTYGSLCVIFIHTMNLTIFNIILDIFFVFAWEYDVCMFVCRIQFSRTSECISIHIFRIQMFISKTKITAKRE